MIRKGLVRNLRFPARCSRTPTSAAATAGRRGHLLSWGPICSSRNHHPSNQHAVSLDGVFLGIKHGIPLLRDSGGGSIINVSSVAGIKGSPMLAAYNATKGGVRLLTKGVALECAQSGWKIRVNSVHPGVIDTPIWAAPGAALLADGANAVDIDAMAEATVPLGQVGRPADIANGVLFLASDESAYMTGTELIIDGGVCA